MNPERLLTVQAPEAILQMNKRHEIIQQVFIETLQEKWPEHIRDNKNVIFYNKLLVQSPASSPDTV